jgi:hypothetical protein
MGSRCRVAGRITGRPIFATKRFSVSDWRHA